jgi:hypothetical protein
MKKTEADLKKFVSAPVHHASSHHRARAFLPRDFGLRRGGSAAPHPAHRSHARCTYCHGASVAAGRGAGAALWATEGQRTQGQAPVLLSSRSPFLPHDPSPLFCRLNFLQQWPHSLISPRQMRGFLIALCACAVAAGSIEQCGPDADDAFETPINVGSAAVWKCSKSDIVHDVAIQNLYRNDDTLRVLSADGVSCADALTPGKNIYIYPEYSAQSTSAEWTNFTAAPCRAVPCCVIVRCLSVATSTCRVRNFGKFYSESIISGGNVAGAANPFPQPTQPSPPSSSPTAPSRASLLRFCSRAPPSPSPSCGSGARPPSCASLTTRALPSSSTSAPRATRAAARRRRPARGRRPRRRRGRRPRRRPAPRGRPRAARCRRRRRCHRKSRTARCRCPARRRCACESPRILDF